jgi:hypothetical protein
MGKIPVVIREVTKAPHRADVRCTNHGNAMNCPAPNCPGIVQGNPDQDSDEALDINAKVMHDRIAHAVSEFERLHPERVVTSDVTHKRRA